MIRNGLDISLQGIYLYIGRLIQPLEIENVFFVNRWMAEKIRYAVYTEKELRTIHRSLGHPTVNAAHNLMKRENKKELELEEDTRRMVMNIVEDCRT